MKVGELGAANSRFGRKSELHLQLTLNTPAGAYYAPAPQHPLPLPLTLTPPASGWPGKQRTPSLQRKSFTHLQLTTNASKPRPPRAASLPETAHRTTTLPIAHIQSLVRLFALFYLRTALLTSFHSPDCS